MGYLTSIFIFLCMLFSTDGWAADRVVNLTIHYKNVNFAGKVVKAIAVNNQIPAPTLHFREGDKVTINVYNQLDEGTAVHWHGIILPWQMDGVANITQSAIKPGCRFQYQFTLEQSGTYWYHAHAGLQEQQGLYGAFLIDPIEAPAYDYNQDYVVVLSDWSNTPPNTILNNLKKEGDYYSPRFPLQPSLKRFLCEYHHANAKQRKMLIDDYKMMQSMRMSIYDINDVAYDAFLLNGATKQCPWTALVQQGDKVRLRFIGAGGNTIFHVKLPGTEMEVVHVQGNDVVPYKVKDFTIAPGETVDGLVTIQQDAPQIIYVESTDKVGVVYGALLTCAHQEVDYQHVLPFPEPPPVTREMMIYGGHGSMHHGSSHTSMSHDSMSHGSMSHGSMSHNSMSHNSMSHNSMSHDSMSHDSMSHDSMSHDSRSQGSSQSASQFSKTKYKPLKALKKTNDPDKPIDKTIRMELDGWMDRFIWFINGQPEHEAHPILLEPNKRYRIIFHNRSMMHHPMHIHGHWFIVRAGHGEYDPLLHTIDMPPGATIIADLDTDASGQWLFHCHFLYHMMSGMARVMQYSTLIEIIKNRICPQDIIEKTPYHNRPIVRVDAVCPIDPSLVQHPMAHPMGIYFSHFLEAGADPFNNVQRITYKGLYGRDYNKLELFINDAEIQHGTVDNADLDIFYWHAIDQFWAVKGGVNYYYRPSDTPYFQPGIGIEGMMPYFIETDLRGYYRRGSVKIDLECDRETQITNNFFIRAGIRGIVASKTLMNEGVGSGLNQMRFIVAPFYRLAPGISLVMEYEYERSYGAFKEILLNAGEETQQNTLTFGVSLLF